MFEKPEEREARLKAEAKFREANIRRYEEKMKMELPYSPVAVIERPLTKALRALLDEPPQMTVKAAGVIQGDEVALKPEKKPRRKRGAYMKDFRKRPVICPECGHEFTELRRAGAQNPQSLNCVGTGQGQINLPTRST